MTDTGETIYSTMFSSLKHPVRRKILRMLSEEPMTFSQLLDTLEITSSNLTYHLESLGELVQKLDDGVYKLSTFGLASVSTMKLVEEAPTSPEKQLHRFPLSFRWKAILAVLVIGVIILAGFSAVEFSVLNQVSGARDQLESQYSQLLSWSAGTNNALAFLQNVVQLDTAHYGATLLSNSAEKRADLGGAEEQILSYSLTSSDSSLTVLFRIRNDQLSRYQIVSIKGSPVYSVAQPTNDLDSAKALLNRLKAYKSASYLTNMSTVANSLNTLTNAAITEGNIKLNVTVSGNETTAWWIYTQDGVDFETKSVRLVYDNGVLTDLFDDYYLFTIGSTQVNISADQAVQIARDAVKNYSWRVSGIDVTGFNVLTDPVSITFHPLPRDIPMALVPYWQIILYLDNVYAGGVTRLAVGVWADTGAVGQITTQTG